MLSEDGILEELTAVAKARVVAFQSTLQDRVSNMIASFRIEGIELLEQSRTTRAPGEAGKTLSGESPLLGTQPDTQ